MVLKLPRNSTNYVISGTDSFRLSSKMITLRFTNPPREGKCGGNLQNLEKSMRQIYIPDDGYIFVQSDQSGAEALVVAYLCQHGNFRELFLNGIKSHCYVALQVFADVWQEHLANSPINVRELCELPIKELAKNPDWKIVDKLIRQSDGWPAERRFYYIAKQICHACVDQSTEVLTQTGWKKVLNISDTESIMVYNQQTRDLFFEIPRQWHRLQNSDDSMIRVDTPYSDALVTSNHRVLFSDNGREQVRVAEDLVNNRTIKIPICGRYSKHSEKSMKDLNMLKLAIAIQADGHLRKYGWCMFSLQKERKITRLLNLLDSLNLSYKIKKLRGKTFITFYIHAGFYEVNYIDWATKTFNINLLQFNLEQLNEALNELVYWDGSSTSNRLRYFSNNKQNIDVFHTIAHLVDRRASVVRWPPHGLCLTMTKTGFAKYSKLTKRIKKEPYPVKNVYCPTVSTGFFLIRRNGKISITGNSNYGMKAGMFQLNTLEKSKGKIVISKADAERYLSAYHSLFPEIHRWHKYVLDQLYEFRTLYNLFGHPREFWFPDRNVPDDILKKAYAFVPQSTVAIITRQAFINLYEYIEANNLDWCLLADTHDSYMAECPIGQEHELAKKMTEFINVELTGLDGCKFRMKSEACVGYNWAPFNEIKNPKGLKELCV